MIFNNVQLFSNYQKKLNDVYFIFLIFCFQIIFIFQGLDFADAGSYASMYQQIFSAPESVQYYFNYWLSAVIGGTWLILFPDFGLLGIRIAGVLVTTATITLVYVTFKKYLTISNLRLGLFIAVIILSCQTPLELYYDNLSILFWVTGSLLIFIGLKNNKLFYLFIGGFVIGLNVFNRLPNVLGITVIVTIFYYGWLVGNSIKNQIYKAVIFIAGFITALFLVMLIMKLIGHLDIFLASFNTTINMGVSQEEPHNLLRMTKQMIRQFADGISYASVFLIIIIVYLSISQIIFTKSRYYIINKVFLLIVLFAMLLLSVTSKFSWSKLEFFVIGIIFLANMYILFTKSSSPGLKLLSFLGIIMLIIYPVGSAGGFFSAGRVALWFSLPIGIEVFHEFRNLNISFSLYNYKSEQFTIRESQMNIFPKLFIYPCIVLGLYFAFSSPYFDNSSRLVMYYSVPHDHLKGIFTTKERAGVVQELLDASSEYVKPEDYVLAYDNIPMYHYLTETRPFLGNPWPGLYTSGMLRDAIKNSLQKVNYLPVVILQKVNTIDSNWPENDAEPYKDFEVNSKRNQYFYDFLNKFNYKVVWENNAFSIMKPLDEENVNVK